MIPPYVLHPLSANGASFYGGIGGDLGYLTIAASILVGAAHRYRQHECHADRCYWPAWHTHDESGHPLCKRHHPDGKGKRHSIGGVRW